jgi:hypothetical protein
MTKTPLSKHLCSNYVLNMYVRCLLCVHWRCCICDKKNQTHKQRYWHWWPCYNPFSIPCTHRLLPSEHTKTTLCVCNVHIYLLAYVFVTSRHPQTRASKPPPPPTRGSFIFGVGRAGDPSLNHQGRYGYPPHFGATRWWGQADTGPHFEPRIVVPGPLEWSVRKRRARRSQRLGRK